MREYLTDADFERAERNGIPAIRVKNRFYGLHWSKERCITQKYKSNTNKWAQFEADSKVGKETFYNRLHLGWSPEEAALTPRLADGQVLHPKRPIAQEIKDLAEQNGIKPLTLRQRIYGYKWDPMDAATIPVGTKRPNRRKKGWR